ncbi:hypothetical protein K505DRAFT_151687 [Melanomma pulvis-pyrius CBS 109.77]|uniref:Uncharacterized protein n=1 Tax=Melanomma pulvis-pyrius CBS 109.77 TaxID=1314802 RepID=A0A6A6WPY4_9PLEO|nr:hypothetical protein K505DRAFT_151687 [Melanomma pulvis-pyrius CBS 109.77]
MLCRAARAADWPGSWKGQSREYPTRPGEPLHPALFFAPSFAPSVACPPHPTPSRLRLRCRAPSTPSAFMQDHPLSRYPAAARRSSLSHGSIELTTGWPAQSAPAKRDTKPEF